MVAIKEDKLVISVKGVATVISLDVVLFLIIIIIIAETFATPDVVLEVVTIKDVSFVILCNRWDSLHRFSEKKTFLYSSDAYVCMSVCS